MYNYRIFLLYVFFLFLTACNGFFEKDNTPKPASLVFITPEIKPIRIWSTKAGTGIDDDYLKMGFSITDQAILTTSTNGLVTSIDKKQGLENWQIYAGFPITTAPGIGDDLLVVGGRRGEILALQQGTGRTVWKTNLPSQAFAKPAIQNGIVVIKSIDGYIRALSSKNGNILWTFQQIEPNLILRSASNPLISHHDIIAGFANGNLAKLNLYNGQMVWTEPIAVPQGAFAIQRMIDIDADPILFEHDLYAATYQGKISALDWSTGKTRWSHDISSYTGMVADHDTIFITDAKSHLFAFDANSGLINWRQDKLEARVLTAPAIQGDYVVVGDAQGYLHWLSKRDGHIGAREYIGAMYAAPIVQNGILYALTNSGHLLAYRL
ncbi:MAG: outer membrane protein assembly factor BamB [Gammaproteobacteria bacterium RIFCSPHIGHO2_12_FULL_37_34]|nr:MAG: outer membrane protein assembly factor BamB [Gammaproteobacteria bacterium RIFCSPHIGHO2_12_FULL_37_34]